MHRYHYFDCFEMVLLLMTIHSHYFQPGAIEHLVLQVALFLLIIVAVRWSGQMLSGVLEE